MTITESIFLACLGVITALLFGIAINLSRVADALERAAR